MRPYYSESGIEIFLGDCREVLPTLERGVIITDPPYGISAVLGMGGGYKGNGGEWAGVAIEGDADVQLRDEVLELTNCPYAVLGSPRRPEPPRARATLIWDKGEHTGAGNLRFPWKPNYEVIFIAGEGWSADRRSSSVIRINAIAGCVGNRNDGKRFHPFEKPVALMLHLAARAPTGLIVDPFMGSGPTLLAAQKLQRRAVGIETDEYHAETAAKRLSQGVFNFRTGQARQ